MATVLDDNNRKMPCGGLPMNTMPLLGRRIYPIALQREEERVCIMQTVHMKSTMYPNH